MNNANLLLEFIGVCNNANVTPSETEIDAFLFKIQGGYFKRDMIINYCFYFWFDRSTNIDVIENQLILLSRIKPKIFA